MASLTNVVETQASTKSSGRRKRYLICKEEDVEELWKDLELCVSKITIDDGNSSSEDAVTTVDELLGEELHCRTCAMSFPGMDDFRLHYRDDLHRYNLKLKLFGKPPINQEEFCEIEDGISSISGSESEEDTPTEKIKATIGSPKVYFQNQVGQKMSVYRCLLHSKKNAPNDVELPQLILSLPKLNMWAIIMLGGGHFAAAIYQGADIIVHKTFHSYTVRAKQGGSQSSRDNKSGGGSHPKSAGASLRRYNEAAFAEHVNSLFIAWNDVLKKCHLIFHRAASSNQTIMFGGKTPFFDRTDSRLRSIPFPTRRATLKEVQRVWLNLSTIEIFEEQEVDQAVSPKKNSSEVALYDEISYNETSDEDLKILKIQRAKRVKKKTATKVSISTASHSVEDLEADVFPGEKEIVAKIFLAIKQGNSVLFDEEIQKLKEILNSYQEEFHLDVTDVLNRRLGDDCETLLHQTAMLNRRANFVWKLMELGCDPSLIDASGRVPYMVTSDKETRAMFRRFMGTYPNRFNYVKAAIPSPLTDEIEKQKAEKLAEKRKLQKQAKKEKKAIEKVKQQETKRIQEELQKVEEERRKVEEERRKVEEEKARFLALSDREKRALAAERRLLASVSTAGMVTPVLVRCFMCGSDMSGKVPFEYNTYKFCSPPCLQKHRKLGVN